MNEQLFKKLQNVVKEKGGQQYIEHEDEDGNLYLMGEDDGDDDDEEEQNEGDEDDEDYQYDNDMIGGGQQIIDGEIDDEEFMEMMERNGY